MISAFALIPMAFVVLALLTIIVVNQSVGSDDPESFVKVAIYEDQVYWMDKENNLYRSPIGEDGGPILSSAEKVDVMDVDAEDIPLLFRIMDALKD